MSRAVLNLKYASVVILALSWLAFITGKDIRIGEFTNQFMLTVIYLEMIDK
ncbi:hypothetical protein [Brevibacillus laterosporus]|uniref:hypothetical protein n=1 Tax=Brevibacillus laterosporus TaxID=1465 RepID=UPI0018CF9FF6|nr:hypothetical protein [Brevibacillus laterosporus]MED1909761.1 hypothetical protein [Brevibacillus laterosporus]